MGAATSTTSDSAHRESLTRQRESVEKVMATCLPPKQNVKHKQHNSYGGIKTQSGLPSDSPAPSSKMNLESEREDPPTLYDGFDLEGIDKEDLILWSKVAPEGQRLEDVRSHEKQASPKSPSSMLTSSEPETTTLIPDSSQVMYMFSSS